MVSSMILYSLAGLGLVVTICMESLALLGNFSRWKSMKDWKSSWYGQVLLVAIMASYMSVFVLLPLGSVPIFLTAWFLTNMLYNIFYAISAGKLPVLIFGENSRVGSSRMVQLVIAITCWTLLELLNLSKLLLNTSELIELSEEYLISSSARYFSILPLTHFPQFCIFLAVGWILYSIEPEKIKVIQSFGERTLTIVIIILTVTSCIVWKMTDLEDDVSKIPIGELAFELLFTSFFLLLAMTSPRVIVGKHMHKFSKGRPTVEHHQVDLTDAESFSILPSETKEKQVVST